MTIETPQSGYRLIVRQDLRLVQTVELLDDRLTIGRSSQCDISLPHEAVSRQHARVENRHDGWHVIDNDSINGIRVNGQRLKEARLTPGDVIEIRPYAINYVNAETDIGDRSIHLAATCLEPTLSRYSKDVGAVVKQRLEDLYALSRLVIRRKDDGSYWQEVQAALHRSLVADRCVLVGIDPIAGMYRLAPRARPSDSETPLELSRSVLGAVIDSGQGLLIQRVTEDERFAAAESISGSAIGSVICAPVVVEGRTRAVVYADRQFARSAFEADDLDFVMAAVDLAATAVGMDELQVKARELSRVHGRIDAAREMQEMLLPSPIPQPEWGQVAARNEPAERMSGDIYDVAIDRAGRLVISIADVSGKGVPAAFLTGILQNTLRQSLIDLEKLEDIIRRINTSLEAYSPAGCFATMILCRWSSSGGEVEIANAGHHAPLWVTSLGNVEAFPDCVGMPLGIGEMWDGKILTRNTWDDRVLLLSSDGITEAMDQADNEYGLSRVGDRLAELYTLSADHIIAGLLDDVRRFCSPRLPGDDVTLLVVKRRP